MLSHDHHAATDNLSTSSADHSELQHVGQEIVDCLIDAGISWASCVPGESFLPVMDGFVDRANQTELVSFRHEASAAQAAVARARLTEQAGVCLVTRGPGALHAAIAVHTAEQEALPLLLFVGQISSSDRARGAFQEISCEAVFGSMAKWVVTLDRPERTAEIIKRAVRIAEGGRPGPVVIELPEDVLYAPVPRSSIPIRNENAFDPRSDVNLSQQLSEMLSAAERPLILLGRTPWTEQAQQQLQEFAEVSRIPVVAGFRCQDRIDNDSKAYVGHLGFGPAPALLRLVEEADLVIAIGGHLGDVETGGYTRQIGAPGSKTVHLAMSEFDLDRTQASEIGTVLSGPRAVELLGQLRLNEARPWADWATAARASYEDFSRPKPNDLLGAIVTTASQLLPRDAVVCNGAGNYAIWVHRFHRYHEYGSQLAPHNGAMGFGVPAGIAASLTNPGRQTIVYAGDGCFMMAVAELATIAAHQLPVIIVVIDNSRFGTIRMHQEREFPGRAVATALVNPDFVALAHSFGINASSVHSQKEFSEALQLAQRSGAPAVIHVPTDPERLTPVDA